MLPDERGADGRPSSTDFLLYEVPRLRDRLADDFEANTLGVDDAAPLRVLIAAGTLVRSVALYAFVAEDGNIDVIAVDLDTSALVQRARWAMNRCINEGHTAEEDN